MIPRGILVGAGEGFTDVGHLRWWRKPPGRGVRSRSVSAERLPLSDARRAHELLERTAATGKLVLVS